MLSLCRDLLALRRAEQAGGIAPYQELAVSGGLWAYQVGGLRVLANLSGEPVTWPGRSGEILVSTAGPARPGRPGDPVTLGAWQGVITRPAGG
jgi:hypothetical protein